MSALFSGSLVPFVVVVWPLLVGLVPMVPRWRAQALCVLPLAPLPALIYALTGAQEAASLPDLILGVELAAVPGGALYLGMTAVVWVVAGWHAALTLQPGARAGIFTGFWCLTLAGNLAVFLAADVVTFYVAFAAVSLAAWFLVVHDRTEAALGAGRVYITLAVVGEAALLAGLIIGASAADDLQIVSVRDALSTTSYGQWALASLFLGFGIKAGMVPLHIWLPVAHPAAPVPGSAVLSGAIVNAGLIGMILFLPVESVWSTLPVVLGLIGAFGAAVWGLTQRNPKAVLAYSTISQMGLLLVLVGAGSGGVAYYALHHGLAKATLFLCVGVMATVGSATQRRVTLAVAGLLALSVAGLPLSGGSLAKLAGKAGISETLAFAFTLSGVTTTLILGWFLMCLANVRPKPDQARFWSHLLTGVAFLAVLAFALPWMLWDGAVPLPQDYPLQPNNLLDGLWPVLAGLALLAVVARVHVPERQPGDVLNLVRGWTIPPITLAYPKSHRGRNRKRAALRLLLRSKRAERLLLRWPVAGSALMGAALALALLIGHAP